jgi:general secretion pathway protein C
VFTAGGLSGWSNRVNHNPRMVTNSYSKWGVRLGTLALWAAAGASVVFWGLRLSAPAAGMAAPVALAAPAAPDAQALARLLGAVPAAPGAAPAKPEASLSSRFALIGVLSGRRSGGGAALIAVDGKPAKPFRLGAEVDQGLVLQALGPRQAQLGASLDGPSTLTLDMPLKN